MWSKYLLVIVETSSPYTTTTMGSALHLTMPQMGLQIKQQNMDQDMVSSPTFMVLSTKQIDIATH